ncbi:hypothetical protein Tco_0840829 [Tanacetum coccineum]|uniref:MAK10-like protein n=1 Tax=Tanacetum coccineum TaxID=301880 RepID=A0ABQ5AXD9_9ASTR
MEAHIAPMQPTHVNKITSSCEICSGPHDTQYCMENPEQAFIEYASSRIDEVGGKWYTFKPEKNNLGDTYNPSWKNYLNLSQSNLEGLVSNFMASQDTRLSKFEADFKQQQSEMTNKIDIMLKAITDRIAGALPSDTAEEEEREREGDPKDTNTIEYDEEQRDTTQLERKNTTTIDNLGSNRDDEGIEWLDVEEPLDLVDTTYYNSIRKNGYEYRGRNFIGLGRDMHEFVGNMSYVMNFTILENIETNIDPSLSNVVFGWPFVEITV